MITLNAQATAQILQGTLVGENVPFVGVSIDSRSIAAGNLFVAIKGAAMDGHDYVIKAYAAGAVAVIVDHLCDVPCAQIIVDDTTLALGQLAKYWREQFEIPVVGITGSCGKTTTTQMIGAILNQVGPTLVPQGNKNNQFGVPLTLFNLNSEHRYAVIEMGADRGGEIRYLAKIVQPDVSVITLVAPVHLDVCDGIGFGTIDGVFKEKSEIFHSLGKEGAAIVNADDAFFSEWQTMLQGKMQGIKVLTFGYQPQADITAKNFQSDKALRYSFDLVTPKGNTPIQLSAIGRHNIMNALAASAVALALGIPLAKIQAGLSNVPLITRRMNRFITPEGAVLIDDSYNSNVKSAKAVLDMLAEHPGRKIAILGDMREIGAQSAAFHHEVGAYAKSLGIHQLFAFGSESRETANAFGSGGESFLSVAPLVDAVQPCLDSTTLVIVKGSFGMGMDKIVQALTHVTLQK